MSPALFIRPTARRNRRRHTAARASLRRVTLAAIAAGAVTLAAVAVSAARAALFQQQDDSIAAVARWTTTGAGPLLVRDLQALPSDLNAATWTLWSARVTDYQADEDDIAAADTRLLEFIRGTASHVDEADLEIASPAIRARAFEKLD